MLTLYKHQQEIVDRFPKKLLIAHGLGSGKTITALALANKSEEGVLIICPKMLKEKWCREATAHHEWGHTVVTKEEFRRDYKKLPRFNAVIVDEAHNTFGSLTSQGYKALYSFLKVHNVEYVWLLTGTPYTSTPMSVYALGRLLGVDWKWIDWRSQYFAERHLGRRVIFEPKTGIENEIAARVREIGSIVRLDECIDIPEQTFAEETFEFTKEQKDELKKLQETESNPLVRFGKSHQIAQGILIGDEYNPSKTFPCLKNDRIVKLAEENDKMIVFSRYNLHLEHLHEMLEKKGILSTIINGDTKDRDGVILAANNTKRLVLLIQADCAEGYELPTFSIVVHAAHTYSFVKYNQSLGRVLRINAPKPNYYLSLITKESADIPVMEAVRKKEDFHAAIFVKNNPSLV